MLGKVSGNKITVICGFFKSNFVAVRVPKVTVSKGNLSSLDFFFYPSFHNCLAINVGLILPGQSTALNF